MILITGGAGFIGTHLCRSLLTCGYKVISLDLKGIPELPVAGVLYLTGDARNLPMLLDVMRKYSISAVYHLAAMVSVPLCQKDAIESYSHNVNATLSVLESCRLNSIPTRIVFASSAALYGSLGDDRKPLNESKIANQFSSFYAAQKHASEKMIELYTQFYKIPSLIFRFFNVYGQGQDPESPYSGVITVFTQLAKNNRKILLYNSGVQTRDFISVTEVTHALASALELATTKWDGSVINLGSGIATSVRELAELVHSIVGSSSVIEEAGPREGDVLHSLADIGRAHQLLDFIPSKNLSAQLSALLAPARNHRVHLNV